MTNRSMFISGAVGGLVGSAGGAVLAQPGGVRRGLGVAGLVVTAIVTGLVAGLLPNMNDRVDGGSVAVMVAGLALLGVLWLPWVAAKTAFPWTKFRWHWSVTRELVEDRYPAALMTLGVMALSGVVSVIAAGIAARGIFAIAFVAYALSDSSGASSPRASFAEQRKRRPPHSSDSLESGFGK